MPGDRGRYHIDYILIKQRFRNHVKNCKSYPSVDVNSDHNPIIILGCLILTWYFYARSPPVTNGYYCWHVLSFKPLLSKFEPNPLISLQVTVSESNQPANFLQRWKKVNFVCWLNTTLFTWKNLIKNQGQAQ